MAGQDWYSWHDHYDNPGNGLARRLELVQDRIRAALDTAAHGPIRVISVCAGRGWDLIGALAGHPRCGDVTARLVEMDPRNTAEARRLVAEAGLTGIEVVTGDASLTSAYAGFAPADLVIVCGVFGNMRDADIERTISYCMQLCAAGGTVVWTRGRFPAGPDIVPQVCAWFEERGFSRQWLSGPDFPQHGVGAHVFPGPAAPLAADETMFTFTGHDPLTGPPSV